MGLPPASARDVISKDGAWKIIQPWKEDLVDSFLHGWSSYCELASAAPKQAAAFEARTRASIVHDLVVRDMFSRFEKRESDGIRLCAESNTLYLILDELIAIRLKKLGKDGKPKNSKTDRQRNWDLQAIQLPGMPPEATNSSAGYQLNGLQTEIEKISVTCYNYHRHEWTFVLFKTDDGTQSLAFPEPTDLPGEPKKSIVIPKVRPKKAEGQKE